MSYTYLIPVDSSAILQVGYVRATRDLDVWFTSGHGPYNHPGVPEAEFWNLINAESVGAYYHAAIKNQYNWNSSATFA